MSNTTDEGHPTSPDLPPPLLRFLELYAEGSFWESHEVLEDPWRAHGSAFYQGLILYASAFVHWQRHNAHGVRAQLAKALDRLEAYPATYLGLDVDAIRRHCVTTRRAVERHPDDWPDRISPLSIRPRANAVRGDEPELDPGG